MSEVDLTSIEYCDPFNEEQYYWMRVEHLGRYYYVLNNIDEGLNLLDIACANGYGTKLLSKKCDSVTGIDKNEGYRKATFKDIVILLRTTSNIATIYERELTKKGFPVFSDTTTNYFETLEIQTILALLKIVNNPNDDISISTTFQPVQFTVKVPR